MLLSLRHMTFDQYCEVIEATAKVHGYSMFLPSMFQCGSEGGLRVCDILPAKGTDEAVAGRWAAEYLAQGNDVFLAFRGESGIILVREYVDGKPGRQRKIPVSR